MMRKVRSLLGWGGLGLNNSSGDPNSLENILLELQGFQVSVMAGVGASTPSAAVHARDGKLIGTSDNILSVVQFASGVPSDITSTVTINGNGTIQSTGDTTGDVLLVYWLEQTPAQAPSPV